MLEVRCGLTVRAPPGIWETGFPPGFGTIRWLNVTDCFTTTCLNSSAFRTALFSSFAVQPCTSPGLCGVPGTIRDRTAALGVPSGLSVSSQLPQLEAGLPDGSTSPAPLLPGAASKPLFPPPQATVALLARPKPFWLASLSLHAPVFPVPGLRTARSSSPLSQTRPRCCPSARSSRESIQGRMRPADGTGLPPSVSKG